MRHGLNMVRTAHVLMLLGLAASPLWGQSAVASKGVRGLNVDTVHSQSIEAGAGYRKRGLHRALLGGDYRQLWGTRIWVPLLDLRRYAGGLQPVEQGGGLQTISLHLVAADGRKFSFRSVNKIGFGTLAPDLRNTPIGRVWQDQVSALYPAGALVVPPLLQSVGVLTVHPQLFIMPDDPALGPFRRKFSGMLGMLEQWPTPPFDGAREITTTEQLYERLREDPHQRVDARGFLAARLMDMYIGDLDRHEDQWLWLDNRPHGQRVTWEPLGIDRDYAFVQYRGLIPKIARIRYPELVQFGDHYPSLVGLNWHARRIDRRLLGELDLATWDSVAHAMVRGLTDSVIDLSVRQLPSTFYREDGAGLTHALRLRRDQLPEMAHEYYRILARDAEVYGTHAAEEIEAVRGAGGTLDLTIRAEEDSGSGALYYHRRFDSRDTKEVRVYTGSGADTVLVAGVGRGPGIRIVSDSGTTVMKDVSHGGWTQVYAPKRVALTMLPASYDVSADRQVYRPDSSSTPAAQRDWGHSRTYSPWIRTPGDAGLLIGAGTTRFGYGFRQNPYAFRLDLRAGYGTAAGALAGEIMGDFREENSATHLQFRGYASGADVHHFYGFGNQAPIGGSTSFNNIYGDEYQLSTTLGWSIGPQLTARAGPVLNYSSTDLSRSSFIRELRPYGSGEFGELGAAAGLNFDSRDTAAAPTRGAHLLAEGHVYPPVWDVASTFGSLHAEAATYLTAPIGLRPTLALRVAGTRVWGSFPYQEAAFIGGHGTVRGLYSDRYAGDASAYGNAELRVPVTKFNFVAPGELGVFGLADIGRVWLDGESSNTWHSAFGAGISVAYLNRKNTVTLAVARGDGRTALYLRSGFMF